MRGAFSLIFINFLRIHYFTFVVFYVVRFLKAERLHYSVLFVHVKNSLRKSGVYYLTDLFVLQLALSVHELCPIQLPHRNILQILLALRAIFIKHVQLSWKLSTLINMWCVFSLIHWGLCPIYKKLSPIVSINYVFTLISSSI